jgi:Holliday junction resolvasome RuvABC endonuclease subunit
MTKILALDLATRTGWAHSDGPSGVQDFSLDRGESAGMRLLKFRGWLGRIFEEVDFDVVAYEQPHYRGGHATEVLAGMVGILQEWAAENWVETAMRHSREIKRHATGSGNASKDDMVNKAVEQGWNPQDDNEADALWLLDLMKRELPC